MVLRVANLVFQVAILSFGVVTGNRLSIQPEQLDGMAGGSAAKGPQLVVYWPEPTVLPQKQQIQRQLLQDLIQEQAPGSFLRLAPSNSSDLSTVQEEAHHGTICLMESHSSEPVNGSQSVQLGNVGTEPLYFRIAITPNSTDDLTASWVLVDQDTGVILPGQFVEMKIDYATASLYQGEYDADLTIYDISQEPEQSLSIFHLTMQVYCTALDITQPAVGTVDYSAISTQPPVFPESPTIQFQEDVPAWLEADFNSRRASSDIEYFVANIVFPTPVILDDFLISMLKAFKPAV